MRALVPTRDHRAEHLRQPGAEVAAGGLREIADVEPGAGNNRARRHSHSVQFPEQRCSACGFRQAGWSAPAAWVAGTGGLLAGLPVVPPGSSCGKCSQGTMRRHASPLARHNRAICMQTTEPAIKPAQVNIRSAPFSESVLTWRAAIPSHSRDCA